MYMVIASSWCYRGRPGLELPHMLLGSVTVVVLSAMLTVSSAGIASAVMKNLFCSSFSGLARVEL